MSTYWTFNNAGQIIFGNGAISKIPDMIKRFQADKVAVLTDPGIKQAGLLDKLVEIVDRTGIDYWVYDQAMPEPTLDSVMTCYSKTKEYNPNLFIALGGGSSIDLAKMTSLLLTHGGSPSDYYGENKVTGEIRPIISIPTTAGTGSEISPVAVVTDEQSDLKIGISDNYLRSAVAILDPEVTVNLPPYITACTGIDALSQAIEAYFAKNYQYAGKGRDLIYQGSNPMSDHFAEKAIELISENIIPAVHQGENLQIRSNMLLGSLYSAIAFSNSGTSLIHALAYPIARITKKPHGEIIGALLPHVMKYNAAVLPEKFARIAELLGETASNQTRISKIEQGIERVFYLLKNSNLPTRLSQIGIRNEQIEEIVQASLPIERLINLNPRNPNKKDIEKLLQEAL